VGRGKQAGGQDCGSVSRDQPGRNFVARKSLPGGQAKPGQLGDLGRVVGLRYFYGRRKVTEVAGLGGSGNRGGIDLTPLDQPAPLLVIEKEGLLLMADLG